MIGDAVLVHASGHGVDYDAIKSGDLDDALQAIGEANLRGMPEPAQYAFLLNAYNICTIHAVRRWLYRDGKRRGTLKNPLTRFAFFFLTPFRVAKKWQTLYGLEYRTLKPFLRRDPRGHFALVCGSAGCPPLREGIYHGGDLDAELDLAGRAFMADARLNRDANVLHLPIILKWYKKDFAQLGSPREVYHKYGNKSDVLWSKANHPRIRWIPYDWTLNKA